MVVLILWKMLSPLCGPVTLPQDKLECTEELGDLISQVDANMALSVYLRANAAEKVVNSFSQRGEFDKMVAYASKVGVCVCVLVLLCIYACGCVPGLCIWACVYRCYYLVARQARQSPIYLEWRNISGEKKKNCDENKTQQL